MWIPTNDYLESHRQLLCKLVLIDKFSFSSKGSLNSQHFLRFSPWSGNHRLVLITCHRPTPTAQFSKTMRKKRFTQNTSETRFSKRRGKHKNYRSPVCNLCFFFLSMQSEKRSGTIQLVAAWWNSGGKSHRRRRSTERDFQAADPCWARQQRRLSLRIIAMWWRNATLTSCSL